jgi:sugar lactone lactonase YvrE
VVAEGLAFPNAMVITPDAQTLMVAESYAARISAFDIQADGSLSPARVWAQFDRSVTPDGICLDAEGAIWVASPGTRETFRVNANADVSDRISMETIPLACMLGGPERRTLFLLSTESLNPQDRQARGRIEAIEVDVPGAGLP